MRPYDAMVERLRNRTRFVRLETIRLIEIAKVGHYSSVFSAAEMVKARICWKSWAGTTSPAA
jgi:transketolase